VKTVEAMQNDLYDAMLSAYDFMIADHLHPVNGLYQEVISRIGKVFAEKMRYEPYTKDSEYISEVGILVENKVYSAPEYLRGAARMLNELKIPYTTYTAQDDFSSQKLIILPKKTKCDQSLFVF